MEIELKPISSLENVFEEVEEVTPPAEEAEEESTEDTEDVDAEEEDTEDVDLESADTYYKYLVEAGLPFDELPEGEKPTLEFLREQQETLPEKYFMGYVESRPPEVQEFLTYQASFEKPTIEQLRDFWVNYIDNPQEREFDVETPEGAREYLKSRPEFTKTFKTEERINQALDMLEDGAELIDRAKELRTEEQAAKTSAKQKALQEAETAKRQRIENEKKFAGEIQKTVNTLQWQDERKRKAIAEITPANITQKWNTISKNPKALVQFADFLSYFDGEGFDKFYDLIEGKNKSKQAGQKKAAIEKDSLGKLLGSTKAKESSGAFRKLEEDFA